MAVDQRESHCNKAEITARNPEDFPSLSSWGPGKMGARAVRGLSGEEGILEFDHNVQRVDQVKEGSDMQPVCTRFPHMADLDVSKSTNPIGPFQSWDFCAHTPWAST